MKFKTGQIAQILGCTQSDENKWIDSINNACDKFEINTRLRLAAFIAQVGHESGRLKFVSENLNYSAAGLLATFPKYFDEAKANSCARQPEKIANVVYANRMGNNDSGDGWKYRGRGLIQITGKSAYDAFSQGCGIDAVNAPDILTAVDNAALSAAWFWNSRSLNSYADRSEFSTITQRINGGTNGAVDRNAIYQKALVVLADSSTPPSEKATAKPDVTAPITSEKAPAASNPSIAEPRSQVVPSGNKYPWNFVTESRSGHYSEVDDSPGDERLNMTHRLGSYWEIDRVGTYTHKSVLDSYKITKYDSYDYTGGNYIQHVKGQSYRSTSGDTIIKAGTNVFINTNKVQVNASLLAVTGEIVAPLVTADLLAGGFSKGLSKESMLAWDIGSSVGGGISSPILSGSMGFMGGAETESQLTNQLSKQSPNGTPVVTNGVLPGSGTVGGGSVEQESSTSNDIINSSSNSTSFIDSLGNIITTVGVVNAGILDAIDIDGNAWNDLVGQATRTARAIANSLDNPTKETINALSSAASAIDATNANNALAATPVFIKHVSFDKPTLLSQSTLAALPDPTLYTNNVHVVVNSSGVGELHMSNGTEWIPISGSGVVTALIEAIHTELTGEIAAETTARILAIISESNARSAAILDEAITRQQAIEQGLLTEAMARGAAIVAESSVRQTAELAITDHIITLTASVAANIAAAIQQEQNARADAVSAEANARQILAATVAGNTASIFSESITRANSDNALSTQINALTATTANNTAAISTEQTVRASAVSALATSVSSLQSTVAGHTASILSEQTTRATADSALSSSLSTLTATVGNHTASILSESIARANADSALSTNLSAVTTTVGGHTATLATQQTSINGISTLYSVRSDVNGYVSGFELTSNLLPGGTSNSSAFNILADNFKIQKPGLNGGTPYVPFSVTGDIINMNGKVRISSGNLTVGGGGKNILRNSGPSDSTTAVNQGCHSLNWVSGYNTNQVWTRSIGNGPVGFPTMNYGFSTAPLAGTNVDMYNHGGTSPLLYQILPSKKYEVSMYIGTTSANCTGRVYVTWYNSAFSIITSSYGSVISGMPSTPTAFSSWEAANRSKLMIVSPSNAAYCVVGIRMVWITSAINTVYHFRTYFGEAYDNQTDFSPWALDAQTVIDGGTITTDTITANQIAANTITANEIAANTITAAKIATGTITAGSAVIANACIDTLQIAGQAVTVPSSAHWDYVIDPSSTLSMSSNTADQSIGFSVVFPPSSLSTNVSIACSFLLPQLYVAHNSPIRFSLVVFDPSGSPTTVWTSTSYGPKDIFDIENVSFVANATIPAISSITFPFGGFCYFQLIFSTYPVAYSYSCFNSSIPKLVYGPQNLNMIVIGTKR